MKFKVVRTMVKGRLNVVVDGGEFYTVVAELVWRLNDWNLFHVDNNLELTYAQRDEMNVFAKNYITTMKITDKLTK